MTEQSLEPKLTAAELMEIGDNIRMEEPVLWAVIRGRSHESYIGILTGIPTKALRRTLQELVKSHILTASPKYDHVYFLNRQHKNYGLWTKLRIFYDAVELKWLEEHGLKPDKAVATSTASRWKLAHPEEVKLNGRLSGKFDDELTVKQAQFLVVLGQWADGSTFRPIDVGRAQGYTQAGYSKNNLEKMVTKGFVVNKGGMPLRYRLSQAGVDKIEVLVKAGVQAAVREQVDLDSL